MNITLRNAAINDLESVYLLVCDLEGYSMDRIAFENVYSINLSNPNIYYLIAEKENRIVGFLSLHVQHILHHSKPTCELQELNISSELRGYGIGALLMNEAERIAKELNLEEIELTTKIHRERAQSFYNKLGYKFTHMKFVKNLLAS
ncbi:MAG: GNAT family N-acetyltransferase [Bacteroidales bacterium]|nr:MAG: GNAT family N-acetyltransferase [Bacteroidales bacterium]